jgi:hypothetical protein
MGALALSFSGAMYAVEHNLVSLAEGLAFAIPWTLLVVFSRLYLGVHSPADTICGLVLGAIIVMFGIPLTHFFLGYLPHDPVQGYLYLLALFVVLMLLYPRTPAWTSAYGDTCVGTMWQMWLLRRLHACCSPWIQCSCVRRMQRVRAQYARVSDCTLTHPF